MTIEGTVTDREPNGPVDPGKVTFDISIKVDGFEVATGSHIVPGAFVCSHYFGFAGMTRFSLVPGGGYLAPVIFDDVSYVLD